MNNFIEKLNFEIEQRGSKPIDKRYFLFLKISAYVTFFLLMALSVCGLLIDYYLYSEIAGRDLALWTDMFVSKNYLLIILSSFFSIISMILAIIIYRKIGNNFKYRKRYLLLILFFIVISISIFIYNFNIQIQFLNFISGV